MALSRRQAMQVSGATLAGLSIGLQTDLTQAQSAPTAPGPTAGPPPAPPVPDHLVTAGPLRALAPLALEPDGSAKEYTAADITPITDPPMWRFTQGKAPAAETDYRKLKIVISGRGMSNLTGTMTYDDLAKLPTFSQTVLLQCGAPNPHGIVKWTGVHFSDVCKMLGVQANAEYCRFIGSDRYYADEDMESATHPQVMLAWMMNDQPLPPEHGAPIRSVIPFRYGARSVKAITEIVFASPGLPTPQLPG